MCTTIPSNFDKCSNAENALWHIPTQEFETTALWIGFIPTPERYAAIYQAAQAKNLCLVNNPEQHLLVQEFDRAYPLLQGLTPDSATATTLNECLAVGERLGYPLFVRGSVRSAKSDGWAACVAYTPAELERIAGAFLASAFKARGRVILRQLVKLRHIRYSVEGFPLGREYRVFFYDETVVGCGYYWEGQDPLKQLAAAEREKVLALAREAAQRLRVPFVAVDVGQLEDESWIVIEVNDAQFAGTCEMPALPLWNAIVTAANV